MTHSLSLNCAFCCALTFVALGTWIAQTLPAHSDDSSDCRSVVVWFIRHVQLWNSEVSVYDSTIRDAMKMVGQRGAVHLPAVWQQRKRCHRIPRVYWIRPSTRWWCCEGNCHSWKVAPRTIHRPINRSVMSTLVTLRILWNFVKQDDQMSKSGIVHPGSPHGASHNDFFDAL